MRTINAFYLTAAFLGLLCNNNKIFCKEIEFPAETEQLRLFLLKGYTSAKSILEDVRIEYEMTQVPVNLLPLDPAFLEAFKMKKQPDIDRFRFTHVQEYIQKHSKERWVFLYYGKSSPTEDVSYRAELVGKKNSPRFIVFDGQYILDYQPVSDGFTQVGRATIKASKTALFESYGSRVCAPVQFFGYYPGLMPDDALSSPQLKIQTKPEKISDLVTYKVSTPIQINKTKYNVVYWLAPERSCLPVKIEVERNGRLSRRLEVKDFFELEDVRWAIKSIIQRNFGYREDEEVPTELVNLVYAIRKLELHPDIDDEKIFFTSPDRLPEGVHVIDKRSGSSPGYVNYPAPPSLIGEALPDFNNIKVKYFHKQAQKKKILICFFDMQQRPSRNCLRQLSKRAQELKKKDVVVVAVQSSKVDENKLNEWAKKYKIPFTIGMVQGYEEKTCFVWGVRSLPWLILTDRQHIVTAEGFSLAELSEKIK